MLRLINPKPNNARRLASFLRLQGATISTKSNVPDALRFGMQLQRGRAVHDVSSSRGSGAAMCGSGLGLGQQNPTWLSTTSRVLLGDDCKVCEAVVEEKVIMRGEEELEKVEVGKVGQDRKGNSGGIMGKILENMRDGPGPASHDPPAALGNKIPETELLNAMKVIEKAAESQNTTESITSTPTTEWDDSSREMELGLRRAFFQVEEILWEARSMVFGYMMCNNNACSDKMADLLRTIDGEIDFLEDYSRAMLKNMEAVFGNVANPSRRQIDGGRGPAELSMKELGEDEMAAEMAMAEPSTKSLKLAMCSLGTELNKVKSSGDRTERHVGDLATSIDTLSWEVMETRKGLRDTLNLGVAEVKTTREDFRVSLQRLKASMDSLGEEIETLQLSTHNQKPEIERFEKIEQIIQRCAKLLSSSMMEQSSEIMRVKMTGEAIQRSLEAADNSIMDIQCELEDVQETGMKVEAAVQGLRSELREMKEMKEIKGQSVQSLKAVNPDLDTTEMQKVKYLETIQDGIKLLELAVRENQSIIQGGFLKMESVIFRLSSDIATVADVVRRNDGLEKAEAPLSRRLMKKFKLCADVLGPVFFGAGLLAFILW